MQILINPDRKEWKNVLQRPYADNSAVLKTVQDVLTDVKARGDEAVKELTKKFTGVALDRFLVSAEENNAAENKVTGELKQAIQQARKNIEVFHAKQLNEPEVIETLPGIQCWRKSAGIEKVGLYIPGGTAPLFSTVLMLAVPAQLAGCKEIVLCTPCDKEGKVHPAILYAAQQCGITKVFKIGGAQAIAAMAFGTKSVPAVYKIFGPGNQYVTAAKQLVQMQGIAIDMPAGPSEVCVLADETAEAKFVAADLLSQAEHGVDSQVLLVSTGLSIVNKVQQEVEKQLSNLSRKEIAVKALTNSKAIVVNNIDEAIDLVNEYAAEHLIISCKDADAIAERITNAGSVFIGNYSPESVGDYASGTNHTLPTNGFAKAYSGVSVDSFVKKITYQKLSEEGLKNIASTVVQMAEAEGLDAHANAVKVRMAE
ncbi:histidinol dehydrogenase [Flavisolibacter ginsenosidimutans]|uniref:Histidinol dehydrogenase n=1 Tax=Flavisolibacter ginsenosidimutans TaxID=661481 RepID=A0A5B8UIL4_9BACT|nr:histidinol dehydrogenase [Flavisolibacter ginsenosidimutans]QEC55950.1 histidinol dehydrogenase [Flavisolibacter ginsenosidimutans]